MDINEMFLNACKNGQKGVIQAFLKKGGIDFDKRDKYGNTCLMYAITEKRTTMVKFLVERGADISIKDNQEHKAIDYSTANGLRDIISILTSDITETNITGDTPLHQACYNEQSEVVKEL